MQYLGAEEYLVEAIGKSCMVFGGCFCIAPYDEDRTLRERQRRLVGFWRKASAIVHEAVV